MEGRLPLFAQPLSLTQLAAMSDHQTERTQQPTTRPPQRSSLGFLPLANVMHDRKKMCDFREQNPEYRQCIEHGSLVRKEIRISTTLIT